jgi:hypothetical protein
MTTASGVTSLDMAATVGSDPVVGVGRVMAGPRPAPVGSAAPPAGSSPEETGAPPAGSASPSPPGWDDDGDDVDEEATEAGAEDAPETEPA